MILIAACAPMRAETQSPPSGFADRWAVQPAAAPTRQGGPQVTVEQALYLIRSSLLTLNDANRSGNYSVLRDLAAPEFQARNSAADLALAFSDLRARKFDLFGAALLAPRLSAAPNVNGRGMLRLSGTIPTRPLQIDFDLMFQDVGGSWRLHGLSVATPAAAAEATSPQAEASKH
ncbi:MULTISPECIES: hypothetical protein [unclassified Bradyrhizobium]|uniref:hypothetical protein n=1 Tax=unclassified Bradyrhizobium TaxID=2631580 RepID=UPI0017F24CB5|nr:MULTISPECIES: hypothetical protein [unclassified Bradyrhizobium]MBB4260628.1 hypothetical protein [Bradyrhizobium sp. CIR3A]MBB4365620.1 hypothetical protein [Bradyrhizobium sp. CIR18]MBB4425341.1 hypothetical protein [Bradyrhizobium sp. CIR48]NYG46897.1 hypothetical protein [Bradyrhizobium sp. IAR9]